MACLSDGCQGSTILLVLGSFGNRCSAHCDDALKTGNGKYLSQATIVVDCVMLLSQTVTWS
jgi:hypothetical protein